MDPNSQQHGRQLTQLARGASVLLLSFLVCPFALVICIPCYLLTGIARCMRRMLRPPEGNQKCVLILGGAKCKALHVARMFKAEGYKTVMAENEMYACAAASFSNQVDIFGFLPTPDSKPEGYKSAVLDLVKEHNPDIIIPVDPRTVYFDIEILAHLPKSCFPLVCDAETFKELEDKSLFMAALESAGIAIAKTWRVKSWKQAYDFLKGKEHLYVYKPIFYDNISRVNIFPPERPEDLKKYLQDSGICETKPFVIQERLVGPEMTSVSLIMNGQILAQSVGLSSPVHQTQNQVDCPEINAWVESFVKLYPRKLVGWFSIDYMQSAVDGKFYPLECNPRLGTNFMLFTDNQGIIPLLQDAIDKAQTGFNSYIPAEDCVSPSSTDVGFCPLNEDLLVRNRIPSKTGGTPCQNNQNAVSALHASRCSLRTMAPSFIVPKNKRLFYMMNVLYVVLSNPGNFGVWKEYLTIFLEGREGVFRVWDPLPFLALNHLQIPILIVKSLVHNKPWNIVDYNIGTLKTV